MTPDSEVRRDTLWIFVLRVPLRGVVRRAELDESDAHRILTDVAVVDDLVSIDEVVLAGRARVVHELVVGGCGHRAVVDVGRGRLRKTTRRP